MNAINSIIGDIMVTSKKTPLTTAALGSKGSKDLRQQQTKSLNSQDMFDRVGSQRGTAKSVDWRARLRPKFGGRDLFWQGALEMNNTPEQRTGDKANIDYLLRPLYQTGGLVWQYTPNIFYGASVNYATQEFQGSNYPLNVYVNSQPPEYPIISQFTANTIDEARYLLGVMHFVKVATKSFFGDAAVKDGLYGTPPPVLLFEYLGEHGFNKVPVIITQYSINLQPDVDYIPVVTSVSGGGKEEVTYVPTKSEISITLKPQYAPHKLRKRFDLREFTTGKNYNKGFV